MSPTLDTLDEYYNNFMELYNTAQKDFNSNGASSTNNSQYLECINYTGEIFKLAEGLNQFQVARISNIIKNVYLIRAELLLRTVGIDTRKGTLTDYEKTVYNNIILLLRTVLSIEPFNPQAMEIFKVVFILLTIYNHNIDENILYLKQVLVVNPCDYQLQFNLGFLYQRKNDLDNSLIHLKLAIGIINLELKNASANKDVLLQFKVKCLNSIGAIYYSVQDRESCKYYFSQALEILPNDPDINNQMGVIYTELRITDLAIQYYNKGIENYAQTHISNDTDMLLASLYMNRGLATCYECNFVGAIESYNKALEYKPRLSLAYQNKLLDLNYISHLIDDPMYISRLHKNINKIFPKVVTDYKQSLPNYIVKDYVNLDNKNKLDITRHGKLNIGFVSGDFICHPVSYFISGILKNINHDIFNISCYTGKLVQLTKEFPHCKWVLIKGKNSKELFDIIVADGIDILFDLSSQTGDNRLDTFVLKPAPIQISYCGYPNSSGIKSMDYHLTDGICNSPASEKYYQEKLIYMPKCFLNYTPSLGLKSLPELVDIQPFKKNGYITFGCFNRYNKINKRVIQTWEKILNLIPDCRFVIKTKEFTTLKLKEQFLNSFQDSSLLERVTILDYSDTYFDHLRDYNLMDISLDTFPYSGTTTSCESLALGVPVLTLKDTVKHFHSQNVTASLMMNSDLEEYVTTSEVEYISKAVDLSNGNINIDNLKKNVREKFFNGNVCNYSEFIDEFENKMIETYAGHKWNK